MVIAQLVVNAADPYVQTKEGLNGATMAGISTGYRMTTESRVEVDFAMTVLDSSMVSSRLFGAEEFCGFDKAYSFGPGVKVEGVN